MKKKLITLAALTLVLAGCGTPFHEKYKSAGWTPDSLNYTMAIDHPRDGEGYKPAQHYIGVSWSLK